MSILLFKKIVFFFLLAAGIFIVLFTLLNWNYMWQNIRYDFTRHLKITTTTAVAARGAPNMLFVPSLGISAPIIYATATTESVWQADLLSGVVHYPGTAYRASLGIVIFLATVQTTFGPMATTKPFLPCCPKLLWAIKS